MKQFQNFLAIFLCVCLILTLTACFSEAAVANTAPSSENTQPSTSPQPSSAVERYNMAAAALNTAAALELTITAKEVRTFYHERYETDTTQTVTLCGQGTEHFEAAVTQTVTQRQTTFTSKEYYDSTTVYMDFDGGLYQSDMSKEDYLARLLPAALLDSSLYGKIEAEGSTLTFSEPTAPEAWAIPQNAVLINAAGTAVLSADGDLLSTSYTASYRYGAVGMEISVSSQISASENTTLSHKAPADPAEYTSLKCIDAPRLVELAAATTAGTTNATAQVSNYFTNSANDITVYYTDTVSTWGSVDELMAQSYFYTETNVPGVDTQANELLTTFQDGVCSNGSSSAQDMKDHCVKRMTDILPWGIDLTKAELTDTGTLYLLELKGSDAFGEDLFREQCMTYAETAQIPTENYSTRSLRITLSIDKYTGFPVYCELSYTGRNRDNSRRTDLNYDAEIFYELGTSEAYTAITGEPLPDAEPESTPTPLLYHVTGTDGEEMWLLGTIHIGDSRTSFLPQKLYDAFNTSDALAVEVDIIDFTEQLMSDYDLAMQYYQTCFYSNGSTLRKHVSKDIYDAAISTSKAMGLYNSSLVYYKAGALESYISDYYMRHIPQFDYEKGVDYRLLTMAKEQNKPVISIENGIDQLTMFTTCSDELQEYLLMSTLATDAAAHHDGTAELYEVWCTGDETEMRALVSHDPSELSEEERPLYEEYLKIMETDRNALMLDKAIEYLQSGEVIFYAVGAAHVMAEDGLVNTLRNAGYTVELVSYGE